MQLSAVLLLGGDVLAWLYDGRAGEVGYWLVRISNFIVYGAVDTALICFNGYLCSYLYSAEERKRAIRPKLVLAIGVLSLLLVAISQHSSMYYYFDDKNVYHRTWSYMISAGLPLCGMLLDLSMLVQRRHSVSKELFVSLASFIAFPVAAGIIQVWFYNFSLVGMSIGISMILMFLVMTVEQNWEIEQLEQSNAETTERLEIATTLNQCAKELSPFLHIRGEQHIQQIFHMGLLLQGFHKKRVPCFFRHLRGIVPFPAAQKMVIIGQHPEAVTLHAAKPLFRGFLPGFGFSPAGW